jgi:phosphatidylserine/phosphatidylglycerophosphate/cardiolipin synthase-like enzyme
MANVYLHLYQLVGKNDVPDAKGMPDSLMHSKVYVFDDGSNTVQLWVGSHNATSRAMLGINVECAVLTSLEKASAAAHFSFPTKSRVGERTFTRDHLDQDPCPVRRALPA